TYLEAMAWVSLAQTPITERSEQDRDQRDRVVVWRRAGDPRTCRAITSCLAPTPMTDEPVVIEHEQSEVGVNEPTDSSRAELSRDSSLLASKEPHALRELTDEV